MVETGLNLQKAVTGVQQAGKLPSGMRRAYCSACHGALQEARSVESMRMSGPEEDKPVNASAQPEEVEEDDDECSSQGSDPELTVDSLSAFTLAALREHLAEAEQQQSEWRIGDASENFALSQFWYTPDTSRALLDELLHQSGADGRAVIMSAPSLLHVVKEDPGRLSRLSLLEYDDRFGVMYPDAFHKYDFNEPEVLPTELVGASDVILLDPPYLNMETLRAFMQSARLLARHELSRGGGAKEEEGEASSSSFTRCMVVTASMLEDQVVEEFGLMPTTFTIEHTSKLSNPLTCYCNFRPKHAALVDRAAAEEASTPQGE